jgi:hypothetical protein
MTEKETLKQRAWQLDDLLTDHRGLEFEQMLADLESKVVEFEGLR